MAEILYIPSSSGYTYGSTSWATGTSTIIQGSEPAAGRLNYYGMVFFDFAAIRAKNVTHVPLNIRIRLKSHVGYSRTVREYLGQGISKDTFPSGGVRPIPATGTTYKEVSCAANAWCEINTNDPAWLSALVDPDTTCIYINRGDHEPSYWEGDGASHAAKPELYIDWTPREPALTAPIPSTPNTITQDSGSFSWSSSTDHIFSSDDLWYEFELSADGGSSWPVQEVTDPGEKACVVDMRSELSLLAGQYYYNASCKIRVRGVSPPYEGTTYYSAWAESGLFAIDYRIVPGAPSSLSPSKSNPFEGETINFTLGRPTVYNSYDASGDAMQLDYIVRLASNELIAQGMAAVSAPTKTLPYTVGALSVNMADLDTTIHGRVTDAEGQQSPVTSSVPFTIRRFRAPVISAGALNPGREENEQEVPVYVTDTGYGALQNNSQVRRIEYRLDGGAWQTASLGAWSGLANSFVIAGLNASSRYELQIRAVNVAPAGTGLSDKTGNAYSAVILEFLPALFVHAGGVSTKSVLASETYEESVSPGDIQATGNIIAGGTIFADADSEVWHEGNLDPEDFAAAVHEHSAADIVSGELAIAQGGTGAGTVLAAHNALTGVYAGSLAADTNLAIALANGEIAAFYWYANVGNVGDIKMYINGDTTVANYTRSYSYFGTSSNYDSNTIVAYSNAANTDIAVMGRIFVAGGRVFIAGESNRPNGVRGHFFHGHAGPVTSIRFTEAGSLYLRRG